MNRNATLGWAVRAGGVTLWAFVVLAAYYVVHKPFTAGQIRGLLDVGLTLAVPVALWWVAAGLGSVLLARLVPQDREPTAAQALERLTLSIGLGLGVLGLLVFALALAGRLQPWLYALGAAAGLLLTPRTVRIIRAVFRDGLHLPSGRLQRFLAATVLVSLGLILAQACMPPTAWDGLAYHLTGPKWYLQAGRMLPNPDLPHLGFPALTEMLYLVALGIAPPAAAQVLHWGFAVLTVALVLAIARTRLDLQTAWVAVALLVAVPTLAAVSSWSYVDAAVVFWETAALSAVLRWTEGGRRWLILAGLCAGFGMSSKYTAVTLVPAVCLLILLHSRGCGGRRVLTDGLLFCLPAVLLIAPWLLKNWAYLGNPVYPFLLAEGAHWDAFRASWYARPGTGLAFTSPLRLLFAPWEATVLGAEGKRGFAATISPLLLIGLPLAWLVKSQADELRRRVLRALAIVAGAQYLLWLAGVAWSASLMQTRLLLPAFPLFAILAAFGFTGAGALRRPVFAADWVLKVVMVIALSLSLFGQATDSARSVSLAYLSGSESAGAYLDAHLGPHYRAMARIGELDPTARVYFLWEPRSFYCPRPARPDALLDALPHLTHVFGSASGIAKHLQAEGFTHILLYRQGMDFVRRAGEDPIPESVWTTLEELLRDYVRPVFDDGGWYALYEWKLR